MTSATSISAVSLRARPSLGPADLAAMNIGLSANQSEDVVRWAVDQFGSRLVMTASFADTLLIDIATRVAPDIEVVFLDTGFHFSETLSTVRAAMERYSLNLTVLRPNADVPDLWRDGVESCCGGRKAALLDRHLLDNADAWLSGLRRSDSPERASTPIVELDRRGLVKVNPIAAWSDMEVDAYIHDHDVLVNPLAAEGYSSIGCWPCTEVAVHGEESRSGRWARSAKTECGLHL